MRYATCLLSAVCSLCCWTRKYCLLWLTLSTLEQCLVGSVCNEKARIPLYLYLAEESPQINGSQHPEKEEGSLGGVQRSQGKWGRGWEGACGCWLSSPGQGRSAFLCFYTLTFKLRPCLKECHIPTGCQSSKGLNCAHQQSAQSRTGAHQLVPAHIHPGGLWSSASLLKHWIYLISTLENKEQFMFLPLSLLLNRSP